ncbi:prohead protease/major capsid protein fusion protein [Telluria sp. B2]
MPQPEQQQQIQQLPMMAREAPVTAVNAETRTVDLVWSTGAGVLRYDWYAERYYNEVLSMDPAHVRMGRMQSGRAPLLNTHSRWDLSSVLGVIRTADLRDGQGLASAEFSKRAEVEPVYQDVVDKIIGNVSVGYTVHAFERIPPTNPGDAWTYMAIDWEPNEVSLVPIGADTDAGVRSIDQPPPKMPEGRLSPCIFTTRSIDSNHPPAAAGTTTRKDNTMAGENTTPAAPHQAAPQIDQRALDQARAEGARAEAERQAGIREAVSLGGLDAAYADQLIARSDMTAADAGMAVLREKARRDAATPTRSAADIRTVSDETDVRRAAISDAIALRCNPNSEVRKHTDRVEAARQYRGFNMIDMARACIEAAGGNVRGLSRREIAVLALNLDSDMRGRAGMSSNSDFPAILAGTVNRTLRAAYLQQSRTFTAWARPTTAPDFRQVARTQLSESSAFKQIKEGGEYKALSFGEGAEKYALSKFGGIVSITWESIVNDDLGAFDRIPTSLAAEAAAIESDIVYGVLTGAQKMSDGKSLFHADHGNMAATGADIDEDTLGEARAAMRKQKGMKGRVLNLTPSFLIVGPDLETLANKYTSASFVAAKAGDVNPNYNTSLEVVVEARIQGRNWFMSAEPTLVDTVEYAYLEGEEGLYTEQRQGFEVDGLQIKARHAFAAAPIDWRGLWKNPGA